MTGLVLLLIVGGYLAVGAARFPVYYRRWYDADRKAWGRINSVQDSQKAGFWAALGVALFWPYYEAGRWFRDTAIHHLTTEEREKAKFEEAQRIVADYNKQKKAEEEQAKAEFERKLREP